jgi:pimeloyl-ACP methyl ester carboxylesterase
MDSHRILWATLLSLGMLVLTACGDAAGDTSHSPTEPTSSTIVSCGEDGNSEECIEIKLSCVTAAEALVLDENCDREPETIRIPKGRPIYALLVSGFYQNNNLDMFHWYNFAQCLQEKGAYVHYAWWNNLLKPYMEGPLHNPDSTPGYEVLPLHDVIGFILGDSSDSYPNKALPAEDYQFQKDAEKLLKAISEAEPDAAIILVGHSMGGNAIARLAENIDINIKIALLAPIDPVGNRTCLPCYADHETRCLTGSVYACNGGANFKRWYAIRKDHFMEAPFVLTTHRELRTNIEYLYHRWQTEFTPPFDWLDTQLFYYPSATRVTSIHGNSTNVQAIAATSLISGYDVYPRAAGWSNLSGWFDGHGEIVGFRGVIPGTTESYPMALKAQGHWPRGAGCEEGKTDSECRVYHLKKWEEDPNYLRAKGFEPMEPDFCMASDNLCKILHTKLGLSLNSALVADAGPDQIVECTDPDETMVTLDGSGSTNSDGDIDSYTWDWPGGSKAGVSIFTYLPLGTQTFTLTVGDSTGKTDTDTVHVTVQDATAPTLSVTLLPNVLWPPNHEMAKITASIDMVDSCDDESTVKLVSITSNEPDDGMGDGDTSDDIQGADFGTDDREFLLRAERQGGGTDRIYTVTYEATDASGNVAEGTTEVTVPHN